jgi:hypothetical protein
MDLWDLLAVTNGAAFVIGGVGGVLVGAQIAASYRDMIDDGGRGVFVSLWLGTAMTFVGWICYKAS